MNAALFLPGSVQWRLSVYPMTANVPCTPDRAPADAAADVAAGSSGHADTMNSDPTRATCHTDLREHAVRLMKGRGRHGLRRRCDGEGKGSNSDQPDHCFLPYEPSRRDFLGEWINSAHVQPVSTRLPEAKSHTEGASVTAICRRIGPACYESLGLTTKAEPANERYNERDARRADWFLQPKDTLTRFCF